MSAPWSEMRVGAVMSAPRLGWLDNFRSAFNVFPRLGIQLKVMSGVFWGQKLQAGIESLIAGGAEVILTMDYDTVFREEHVIALLDAMADPSVSCAMPVQAKRHDGDLMPAEHGLGYVVGHFGLTAFRASALAALPKPWFVESPDKDGRWEGDQEDQDQYFWRQWQAQGHSIHVLDGLAIGHLEVMVMWPDGKCCTIDDYYKRGAPPPWGLPASLQAAAE